MSRPYRCGRPVCAGCLRLRCMSLIGVVRIVEQFSVVNGFRRWRTGRSARLRMAPGTSSSSQAASIPQGCGLIGNRAQGDRQQLVGSQGVVRRRSGCRHLPGSVQAIAEIALPLPARSSLSGIAGPWLPASAQSLAALQHRFLVKRSRAAIP